MKGFAIASVVTLCVTAGFVVYIHDNATTLHEISGLNGATAVDRYPHIGNERSLQFGGNEAVKQSLRRSHTKGARIEAKQEVDDGYWNRIREMEERNATVGSNTTVNNTTADTVAPSAITSSPTSTQPPSATPTLSPNEPDTKRFDFSQRDDLGNGIEFNIYTIMTNGGSEASWITFRNEGHTGKNRFVQSCLYRFMSVQEPATSTSTASPTISPSASPSLETSTVAPTLTESTPSPSVIEVPSEVADQVKRIHSDWR